jgi:hypothetical protein
MRGVVLSIFIFAAGARCLAQKISFIPAPKAEVLLHAENAPAGNQQRAARLKAMFAASGCNDGWLSEQKLADADAPNIICRLPGESGRTIVVGAHYESASSAQRPADNWRAATLLPSLFESLRARPRHHTIVFVAFADHGNEPAGAEFFAAHLDRAELDRVDAMVNLDALGFSPTKVWTSHSDKDLVHALVVTMYALKLAGSQIDIEAAGATDSQPFAARNVPQITIHSMTHAHLEGEIARQFRPDNFYDTYRLICGYVAFLDGTLKPRAHRE